jgi:hypothetical protein
MVVTEMLSFQTSFGERFGQGHFAIGFCGQSRLLSLAEMGDAANLDFGMGATHPYVQSPLSI